MENPRKMGQVFEFEMRYDSYQKKGSNGIAH